MADAHSSNPFHVFQAFWEKADFGRGGAAENAEELDRRIAELRMVESWLEFNLGLLRSSIQMLELQKNMFGQFHTLAGASNPDQLATFHRMCAESMQRFSKMWPWIPTVPCGSPPKE